VSGGDRLEYEKRVNRVIDHVRDHLAEELTLASLARVAAFSPFHFHRIFRAITGETLFGFIQRVRIERAAVALTIHPDQTVLEVALNHGFSSAAAFARAFRVRFGMTATAWRGGGADRWRARRNPERKARKPIRNAGKAPRRTARQTLERPAREDAMNVRVTNLPPHHVAYMRYVGPYGPRGIPETWAKLHEWMKPRDLFTDTRVTLGIAYDDPSVTAPEKCRYDACVVVPSEFPGDKWVNLMDVAGGKYAVTEFVGTAHEIVGVWDGVFGSWLPGSGYQPDDRPCFEIYRGNPTVDANTRRFRCDLALPVRPL
jgi:AraC family transcriptional regulator